MEFGGTATCHAQLAHLAEMSERDNITIAVIPFDGTAFPSSGHGVDYFHGPVQQLDTVLLDTVHGGSLIDSYSEEGSSCIYVIGATTPVALRALIRLIKGGDPRR